jgi:two-component system, OmpR family, sensor histidine kinase SenX3
MNVLLVIVGLIIGGAIGWVFGRGGRVATAPLSTPPLAQASGGTADADRLRSALDALPIGVTVADADGAVVYRNQLARSFAGARHADVLVDEAVEAHLLGAAHGEERSQTLELFGPPKKVVVVRATPIDGGRRGALATIEDITERSRVDAVRTDFVANISHELKTPVGAMIVLAEALAGSEEPEVVERLSNKVADEAVRLGETIDDLLELSRIELGDTLSRDVVSVNQVISDACNRARPLADARLITIGSHEMSGRMQLLGDRRQLVSALGNLVENAVKYSEPKGSVEILASSDGAWVALSVTDHGMGIPARDLDRIFERFYRVDRARSRTTGGTGLGLSIVRHVATNHGGSVAVRSVEGEGSTFTLRIPAAPMPIAASYAGREEEK